MAEFSHACAAGGGMSLLTTFVMIGALLTALAMFNGREVAP